MLLVVLSIIAIFSLAMFFAGGITAYLNICGIGLTLFCLSFLSICIIGVRNQNLLADDKTLDKQYEAALKDWKYDEWETANGEAKKDLINYVVASFRNVKDKTKLVKTFEDAIAYEVAANGDSWLVKNLATATSPGYYIKCPEQTPWRLYQQFQGNLDFYDSIKEAKSISLNGNKLEFIVEVGICSKGGHKVSLKFLLTIESKGCRQEICCKEHFF